jgi:hypothetical protein
VIGAPATVATKLTALAREHAADELMLSTLVPDREARARSLRLVATAMA